MREFTIKNLGKYLLREITSMIALWLLVYAIAAILQAIPVKH